MDSRNGRIEIICGCMFAGKTARLIERLRVARDAGLRVMAFKHGVDSRYAPDELVTHDGQRFPASAVLDAAAICRGTEGADVVGIDEGQFFGRGLVEVCRVLKSSGVRIIVAGIDNDAWGRPFPPFPQLKAMADQVDAMYVPCTVCGRPAPYSQRMVPVSSADMVGGPGEYEPRCESCFRPLPPPAPDY